MYTIQAGELYSKLVKKHYVELGESEEQWKKVSDSLWYSFDVVMVFIWRITQRWENISVINQQTFKIDTVCNYRNA